MPSWLLVAGIVRLGQFVFQQQTSWIHKQTLQNASEAPIALSQMLSSRCSTARCLLERDVMHETYTTIVVSFSLSVCLRLLDD